MKSSLIKLGRIIEKRAVIIETRNSMHMVRIVYTQCSYAGVGSTSHKRHFNR